MLKKTLLRYSIALNSLVYKTDSTRSMIIHHGLMGSCRNFRSICKALSNKISYHLIDARNHGDSPSNNIFTIDAMTEDIHQYIIQKIPQNEKIILLGHSLGALIMLNFTKKYPNFDKVENLILLDMPLKPILNKPSFVKNGIMLKSLAQIDVSSGIQEVKQKIDQIAYSPQVANLIKSQVNDLSLWKTNIENISKQYYKIGMYQYKDSQWKKPVDLIYGQKSDYVQQQDVQMYLKTFKQMQYSNVHTVQNAGHWVHFDNSRRFIEIMQRILNQ